MQDWARPVAAEAARTRMVVSCMFAGGFVTCGWGGLYNVFKFWSGWFGIGVVVL